MNSKHDNIDPAGLRALAKLVNDSVETIISEYEKRNATVPTLDTLTPGPFDAPENSTTIMDEAVRVLDGACGQLCVTCGNPGAVVVKKTLGLYEAACLDLIMDHKIVDILGDCREGMSVAALADKTGVEEDKLERIMRFLATGHIFTEVKQGVFANNRLSIKMLSSDAASAIMLHVTDETLTSAAKFSETIGDPKAIAHLPVQARAPFYKAFGQTAFEHYGSPEGRHRGERFNRGMYGWGQITGAAGLLAKVYPWAEQPEGTHICDLGGGNGYVMLGLLNAHSHLRATIQDAPGVIEEAKQFWATENPKAVDTQRVNFEPVDFFKESPVKGCAFYYLRLVLHDWTDLEAIEILKHVRKAMSPSSKLLIQEFALAPLIRNPENVGDQAPEPLLPNHGLGKVIPYYIDMQMMNVLNGRERSLASFEHLASESGLKLNKVRGCGKMSLLELVPV